MERLPGEIWLEIVDSLEDSHHALAAFARVCRQCYHLAKLRLYERLSSWSADSCISPLLVRTLCENAAIAEVVRYGEFVEGARYDFQAHEVLPAVQTCARLPEDFKSILVGGGPDANQCDNSDWTALLVALLPNLEELEIVYGGSTLKKALEVNRLPRLRKLIVRHWDTEGAIDMWGLMPELLQVGATTLETFEGYANDWSIKLEPDDDAAETPDSTTVMASHETLRDLTLEMSDFGKPGLARLLAACPRLVSLRIHWGDSRIYSCSELDLPGTGQAIREHAAAGLEVLVLNPEDHFEYDSETEGVGSLRSLKRLRKLHLHHRVLAGDVNGDAEGSGSPHNRDALVPLLPASLEELYLAAGWPPSPPRVLAAQVQRLVGNRQDFPELWRVDLGGFDPAGFDMRGWTDYGWTATVVDQALEGDAYHVEILPAKRIRLERMEN